MADSAAVTRRLIAAARRNGGVIGRGPALELGASDALLRRLVSNGTLVRLHPGVLALAGAPRTHLAELKGVLAAIGPAAIASHQSAAWLHGLLGPPPAVHVTVPVEHRSRLTGIHVHRTHRPPRVASVQGLRCTDPARTLVDLAAKVGPRELSGAVDLALSKGRTRVQNLQAECGLAPHRPGARALRVCLEDLGHVGGPNPSVLESRMARLLRRHDLPRPQAEVRTGTGGRYRIDYAYRDCRLAIELYGYAWHHSPEQMHYDLVRQRTLVLDGWIVLIYTWRDVTYEEERVGCEIRAARKRALRLVKA